MPKYCKGCLTNSGYDKDGQGNIVACNITQFNYRGTCPCVKCVVKMICSQACPDYFAFKKEAERQDRYNRRYEL